MPKHQPTITTDVVGAAVDDLPAAPTTRQSSRYVEPLQAIMAAVEGGKLDQAKWVPIAHFASKLGATQVKKDLAAGKRPIAGEPTDWEFESRRDGERGAEGSTLYARLRTVKSAAKKAPTVKKAPAKATSASKR